MDTEKLIAEVTAYLDRKRAQEAEAHQKKEQAKSATALAIEVLEEMRAARSAQAMRAVMIRRADDIKLIEAKLPVRVLHINNMVSWAESMARRHESQPQTHQKEA